MSTLSVTPPRSRAATLRAPTALVITVVHNPEDARIRHRQIAALIAAGWQITYVAPFRAFGLDVPSGSVEAEAAHCAVLICHARRAGIGWLLGVLPEPFCVRWPVIMIWSSSMIPNWCWRRLGWGSPISCGMSTRIRPLRLT